MTSPSTANGLIQPLPPTPTAAWSSGQRWGPYRQVEQLGTGGCRALWAHTAIPQGDESCRKDPQATANTTPGFHGGKLYGAQGGYSPELAGVMNAATLDTRGYTTFQRQDDRSDLQRRRIRRADPGRRENHDRVGLAASGLCSPHPDCTSMRLTTAGEAQPQLFQGAPLRRCMTRHQRGLRAVPHRAVHRQLGAPPVRVCRHFGFDTSCRVYLGVSAARRPAATDRDHPPVQAQQLLAKASADRFYEGHADSNFRHTGKAKEQHVSFFPDVHGAPFNGAEEALSYMTR